MLQGVVWFHMQLWIPVSCTELNSHLRVIFALVNHLMLYYSICCTCEATLLNSICSLNPKSSDDIILWWFGHSCKLVYSKSHDGVTWLSNVHTTDVKQLCGSWEACFWHLIACWSMSKQVWRLWCCMSGLWWTVWECRWNRQEDDYMETTGQWYLAGMKETGLSWNAVAVRVMQAVFVSPTFAKPFSHCTSFCLLGWEVHANAEKKI